MLNAFKKAGILLLILALSGLVFVVVSGDELPPQLPPGGPQTPQNPQQPEQSHPQDIPAPPQPGKVQPGAPPIPQQPENAPQSPAPPQNAPQPELKPPAPPSEKEIARDEIWHAYRELQEVNRILQNSKSSGEVMDLKELAERFYTKSEKLYNDGRYKESRVYAHLAVEALHGIRDILNGEGR